MDKKTGLFKSQSLFTKVYPLDAVGPSEVLSRIPNTEVRFVGTEEGPLRTEGGALLLGIMHTVAETPSPELVLVPGGTTTPGQRVSTRPTCLKRIRSCMSWHHMARYRCLASGVIDQGTLLRVQNEFGGA